MQRTLIIHTGERLIKRENWLVLQSEGIEKRVPIDDLFCVVIDNPQMVMSTALVTAITGAGGHVLFCDEKHLPTAILCPQSGYYRPYRILELQLLIDEDFREALWAEVVRAKLLNQAKALMIAKCQDRKRLYRLRQLAQQIEAGDKGNCEGIGAKMFFRLMYGADFIRMRDDGINAALNYGYTIIRSTLAKLLAAHGFNTVLGIHHINSANYFNLVDDMMEPWRPLADMWTDLHHEELLDGTLTKEQRTELIGLLNRVVLFGGRRMKVRAAMDRYVASLVAAVEKKDVHCLRFPELLPLAMEKEDE